MQYTFIYLRHGGPLYLGYILQTTQWFWPPGEQQAHLYSFGFTDSFEIHRYNPLLTYSGNTRGCILPLTRDLRSPESQNADNKSELAIQSRAILHVQRPWGSCAPAWQARGSRGLSVPENRENREFRRFRSKQFYTVISGVSRNTWRHFQSFDRRSQCQRDTWYG